MRLFLKPEKKAKKEGVGSVIKEGIPWVFYRVKMRLFPDIYFRSPIVKMQSDSSLSYQLRRKEGVEERWELLNPYLETNTSILDIGCNAGLLTAKAARSGHLAIGIEANEATVADAVEYHGHFRDFGIMNKRINPKNVDGFPTFDYVFLFSVYHQLYNHYGREKSEELLRRISQKASDKLFFEAPAQKSKYGDLELPFEDFDEQSIKEYHLEMLDSVIENNGVEYLGSSSRKGGAKGERYLFMIQK